MTRTARSRSNLPRPSPGASGSLIGARVQLVVRRIDRRRSLAVLGALLVAVITYNTVGEAQRRSDALGQTQLVAVATADTEAGQPLTNDNVELIERPLQFVPPDAVGASAVGAVLVADVVAGEVVVSARIGVGASPLAVDERAITVPLPLDPPLLDVGDSVELVGLQVVDVAGSATPTVEALVIATGRVLAVNDEAVTVAVTDRASLDVLRFIAAGSVELLVAPFG